MEQSREIYAKFLSVLIIYVSGFLVSIFQLFDSPYPLKMLSFLTCPSHEGSLWKKLFIIHDLNSSLSCNKFRFFLLEFILSFVAAAEWEAHKIKISTKKLSLNWSIRVNWEIFCAPCEEQISLSTQNFSLSGIHTLFYIQLPPSVICCCFYVPAFGVEFHADFFCFLFFIIFSESEIYSFLKILVAHFQPKKIQFKNKKIQKKFN